MGRKKTEDQELADRATEAVDRLVDAYPDVRIELDHDGPLQLLIATILSAQSTDRRVNEVTPALFARYPDAQAFADAELGELEEAIRSTGFFRQKAKNIQGCCRLLVESHGGEVPREMDQLTALPGVGRKTANVVRGGAFGIPGIVVDTHCRRVSNRLGLLALEDPVKIEERLGELLPRDRWIAASKLLVWHGRYTCKARKPACDRCPLPDLCAWYQESAAD